MKELQAHGIDVLIVLCQRRSAITAWLESHPIPFPILPDEDRSRAKRWGVYQLLSYDAIHMARPASFVVASDGTVRYARVSKHQADHAPIDEILAVTHP